MSTPGLKQMVEKKGYAKPWPMAGLAVTWPQGTLPIFGLLAKSSGAQSKRHSPWNNCNKKVSVPPSDLLQLLNGLQNGPWLLPSSRQPVLSLQPQALGSHTPRRRQRCKSTYPRQ